MGFRSGTNAHDRWQALISEHAQLLEGLPAHAIARETAFRDYLTRGEHRGEKLRPSVFELSDGALDRLWTFVNKAQFDMDACRFDDFNNALRAMYQRRENAK